MGRLHVGLCSYFHAADEVEGDPAITVDGGSFNRGQPEFRVKLLGGGLHLIQCEHERPNLICLALPNRTLVLKFTGSGLGSLVPLNQAVVLGGELILVLGVPGVFLDALLGHFCQQLHLLHESPQLRINGGAVCERGLDGSALFNSLTFARKQGSEKQYDELFNFLAVPRYDGIEVNIVHNQALWDKPFMAYVSQGERALKRIDTKTGKVYWDKFSANIVPMAAQVLPA